MIFIGGVGHVNILTVNGNLIPSPLYMKDLTNFLPKSATVLGVKTIDETKRKCLVHKDKFKIDFHTYYLPYGIDFNQEWELLAYTEGGFFGKHVDRQVNPNHKYTALLYPKCTHTGGELILEDEFSSTVFESFKLKDWILVIFPISMQHESLMVKSGIKYVFKTQIFIDIPYIVSLKENENNLMD